jgi:hypothetical protein
MPNIKPQIEKSNVTFPFTLSVDADIPEGAKIKVKVSSEVSAGLNQVQNFVNPMQAPLHNSQLRNFDFEILPPPDSIAIPFLYAIIIEGNKQKHIFDAVSLAEVGTRDPLLVLVLPETTPSRPDKLGVEKRAYLSRMLFPGDWVSESQVTRPWAFEVIGDTPSDTQLVVTLTVAEEDGSALEKQYHGSCREPIASTTFRSVSYKAVLSASSDGTYTPFFYGLAIEGDGRCYYTSAGSLMDSVEGVNSTQEKGSALLRVPKHRAQRVFEPPPFSSVMGFPASYLKIIEMYERGEFEIEGEPTAIPDLSNDSEMDSMTTDLEPGSR